MRSDLVFFLPLLADKKLLEDNSAQYALVSYDRDVIIPATKHLMPYIKENLNKVSSSKRKIKFLTEFLAVSLAMPIEEYKNIEISVEIYEKWLKDPSLLGDTIKVQNKYIQKIVLQLSSPFGFINSENSNLEEFETKFYKILTRILSIYLNLAREQGKIFTNDTWVILFKTLIGVCDSIFSFDFSRLLSSGKDSFIKDKAVDTLFSILYVSGLKSDDVWKTFQLYFRSWSNDINFIKNWGKNLKILFFGLTSFLFSQPLALNEVFDGGIYSIEGNELDISTLFFIFNNVYLSVGIEKIVTSPDIFSDVADSINFIVQTARTVSEENSQFFIQKFPAREFLRLFGSILTKSPSDQTSDFDLALSKNTDSILFIISNFDLKGTEKIYPHLITFVLNRVNGFHQLNNAAFIQRGADLISSNIQGTGYISIQSLRLMEFFDMSQVSSVYKKEYLYPFLCQLFITASEISSLNPEIVEVINSVNNKNYFEKPFKCVFSQIDNIDNLFFVMVATSFTLNISILSEIKRKLVHSKKSGFKQSSLISSIFCFLSVIIKYDKDIVEVMHDQDFIPLIVSIVQTTKDDVNLLISSLQLFLSLIEWGDDIFQKGNNTTSFLTYTKYIKMILASNATDIHSKSLNKIETLYETILSKVNLHNPCFDYYSRQLDTHIQINEDYIINSMKITSPIINYYTINDNLLVSFIEYSKTNTQSQIVIARGSFGKSIWTIKDFCKGHTKEPMLSNIIKPKEITKLKEIESVPSKNSSPKYLPQIKLTQLNQDDELLRDKYIDEYYQWLNWDKYSFCLPLNYNSLTQRTQISNFLTRIGLLGSHNKFNIKLQNDNISKVKNVIKTLDETEKLNLIIVPIIHVIESDDSLESTIKHFRTKSEKLQIFMSQIAEPMIITKESSKLHNLPNFNTSVPVLPISNGAIAFVCTSMLENEVDALNLINNSKDSMIRIIFNETNFDIKFNKYINGNNRKQLQLIVKPLINGAFQITSNPLNLANYIIPFLQKQTMRAKSFAFNVAICMEIFADERDENEFENLCKKREEIIKKELCNDKSVDKELGTEIAFLSINE